MGTWDPPTSHSRAGHEVRVNRSGEWCGAVAMDDSGNLGQLKAIASHWTFFLAKEETCCRPQNSGRREAGEET